MTNRELLMQRMEKEFQDPCKFETLAALVEDASGVSLRLLDFFLCHYSQWTNVHYNRPGDLLPFVVHEEYQQELDSYGKEVTRRATAQGTGPGLNQVLLQARCYSIVLGGTSGLCCGEGTRRSRRVLARLTLSLDHLKSMSFYLKAIHRFRLVRILHEVGISQFVF